MPVSLLRLQRPGDQGAELVYRDRLVVVYGCAHGGFERAANHLPVVMCSSDAGRRSASRTATGSRTVNAAIGSATAAVSAADDTGSEAPISSVRSVVSWWRAHGRTSGDAAGKSRDVSGLAARGGSLRRVLGRSEFAGDHRDGMAGDDDVIVFQTQV